MLYEMETVPTKKVQEGRMEVEMKMLRFSLELTRINRVQNEDVRKILGKGILVKRQENVDCEGKAM